jgi:uracil-DNA glycosylase
VTTRRAPRSAPEGDEPSEADVARLLAEVRACTICAPYLPLGPRPVLQLDRSARVLIVAQAPGRLVHESGRPFTDPSGDRLRAWMGVTSDEFYDPARVAIMGVGLCFPGTGPSGDLPPRPECAPTWHQKLLAALPRVELTLLVGQYAISTDLPDADRSMTGSVLAWKDYWPKVVPLPHPSWRNNGWVKRHPWFEAELVPALQHRVRSILDA